MKERNILTKVISYTWEELSAEDRQLIELAKDMTKRSYAPYSNFCVGAAVRLADGTVVKGANQENAAYPSGLCAERTALFAANANYPDMPVDSLAIACYTDGHFTREPGAPCGNCRQVMLETEYRYGRPIRILLYGENETYAIGCATEMLPLTFVSDNLKG